MLFVYDPFGDSVPKPQPYMRKICTDLRIRIDPAAESLSACLVSINS